MNIEKREKSTTPSGIGGWLILFCIGIIGSVITLLVSLFDIHITLINNGTLGFVTHRLSKGYIEGFFPLFLFEFFGNIFFIIFLSLLLYLFFGKQRLLPLLFKVFIVSYFLFNLLDITLAHFIVGGIDASYFSGIIQSGVYMLVWGSYIHTSKRVKNTFTEISFWNKSIGSIVCIIIIFLSLIGILSLIDTTKIFPDISTLSSQEENEKCIKIFGENSYAWYNHTSQKYTCGCIEGFEADPIDTTCKIK